MLLSAFLLAIGVLYYCDFLYLYLLVPQNVADSRILQMARLIKEKADKNVLRLAEEHKVFCC